MIEINQFLEELKEKKIGKVRAELVASGINRNEDLHKIVSFFQLPDQQYNKGVVLKQIEIFNEKISDKSLPVFKRRINNITNFPLTFLITPKNFLYELRVDEISYKFYANKFLNGLKNPTYNELRKYVINYNLSRSEMYFLLANLDRISIKNENYKKENISVNSKKSYILKESDFVPETFNQENIYEEEVIETLKGNYANGKVLKTVEWNGEAINSQFTDFQAFHICKGLKGSSHQAIYNRYENGTHTEKDVFEAHKNAMLILNEKGREIVNFVLSLPSLPFKCENFKVLFSTLDRLRENNNENPTITLKSKNEEVEFTFVMIDKTKYLNQVRVKNKTTKLDLFTISRDGKVLPNDNVIKEKKNRNITPILEFFYQITENENGLKEAIFNYGIETGNCSICGRLLKDKISKLKGIGPDCEDNLKNR